MEKTFQHTQQETADYVLQLLQPEDEVLKKIRVQSREAGLPPIQVGPLDGKHLEVIATLVAPKKAVEIGTLGGYSTVCLARGLAPQGKLFTLELDERHVKVARTSFNLAEVSDRVEVRVGPALESLKALEAEAPFDLVFIDADKANYSNYLEWAAGNLRQGGVVLADNTFAWGYIAQQEVPDQDRKSVEALRAFNKKIAQDKRFKTTMLPTGEGLTLAVRL